MTTAKPGVIFRSGEKHHVQIWGSYFTQLVGGRFFCLCESSNCGFNESDCRYLLLFNITIEKRNCIFVHSFIATFHFIFIAFFSGCGDLHVLLNEYCVEESLWGVTYVGSGSVHAQIFMYYFIFKYILDQNQADNKALQRQRAIQRNNEIVPEKKVFNVLS